MNIWIYYWESYIRKCILSHTKELERCYFSSVLATIRKELLASGYVDSVTGHRLSTSRYAFKIMSQGRVSTYIIAYGNTGWKVVS